MIITPARSGTITGRQLANTLGLTYIPSRRSGPWNTRAILNWGRSNINPGGVTVYNKPAAVSVSANKLATLAAIPNGVPYTTSPAQASEWQSQGATVFARTLLQSREGRGIIVTPPSDPLPFAPLYTKYLGKRREFRVHIIVRGEENYDCFTVEKLAKRDVDVDYKIRSHSNGWVHARQVENLPPGLEKAAADAIYAVGLDFGAVDLAANQDGIYVLEINTAPGLTGRVFDFYVDTLRTLLGE